jgi:hypothetical protein
MINWTGFERGLGLFQKVLFHIPQGIGEDD